MTWIRDKRLGLAALAAVVALHALSVFWVDWFRVPLEPAPFTPQQQWSPDEGFRHWLASKPAAPWLFVRNWSYHFVKYCPPPVVIACYLVALALLLPGVHGALVQVLEGLAQILARAWSRRRWAVALGGLAAFLFVTGALRQEWAMLGDNAEQAEMLETTSRWLPEPLNYKYYEGLLALGKAVNKSWNGLDALRWGSWLMGLVYLPAAFSIARRLGRDLFQKAAFFAALLTLGNIQLFFGYVETYAFFYAWLAVYFAVALAALDGRAPFGAAVAAWAVLTASHLVGVALLPTLVYLALLRNPRVVEALRKPRVIAVVSVVTVAVGAHVYANYIADKQLPWFGSRDGKFWAVFSYEHLVEMLNHNLLVAPFGIAAVLLGALWIWRTRHPLLQDRPLVFLALAFFFMELNSMTFVAGPGYSDWDSLGHHGLPLALLATYLIFVVFKDAQPAPAILPWGRELAVIVLGLTGLNTLLFILVNHTDLAIARAKEMTLTDKAPAYSPYWNSAPIKLGIIFQKNAQFRDRPEDQARMLEEAAAQFQLGTRIFPQHPHMGQNLVMLRLRQAQIAERNGQREQAQNRIEEARAILTADVQKFPLNTIEWKLLLDLDVRLRPFKPNYIIQSGVSLLTVMNQVGHVACIEGVPFRAAFPPQQLITVQANVGLALLQLNRREEGLAQLRGCVQLGGGSLPVGDMTLAQFVQRLEATNAPSTNAPSTLPPATPIR